MAAVFIPYEINQTATAYFLAPLYISTGRAIAVTTASASASASVSASALASVSASESALLKMLKFLVKVFKSLYLFNPWMDLVDTFLMLDPGLKFYAVPSGPTSVTLRSRSWTLKFSVKGFG